MKGDLIIKMEKRGVALPFNWIFAIIVGAAILVLAIHSATRFIQTSEEAIYTESAAQLISLLDPFETGLASGKSSQINFKKLTRTYYECDEFSNQPFGRQTISFSEQTLGDTWGTPGNAISVKNKYVFAENIVEGKSMYIFSKPFFMSYKVTDLIMISSENYCFYQAPGDIENEVENLNLKNIVFTDSLENCTGQIKVCWSNADCDIKVTENRVVKDNKELYYSGDLIYAAIFSSPEIYECNLKRLKKKFNELSLIYIDKSNMIQQYGCGTSISSNLDVLRNKEISSSKDVISWAMGAEDLDDVNKATSSGCELW